jgi:hypothetical protein
VARRQDPSTPLLLLVAEPLQREGLQRWLEQEPASGRVVSAISETSGAPRLVIWALDGPLPEEALSRELQAMNERWQPAPLLLILPRRHPYSSAFLLTLPVAGLLANPQAALLREAAATLLAGGRMVDIADAPASPRRRGGEGTAVPLGLGQWLLVSGLQQIDAELLLIEGLMGAQTAGGLGLLLLQGRRRELSTARRLLLWLWGPLAMAWSPGAPLEMEPLDPAAAPTGRDGSARLAGAMMAGAMTTGALSLTLRQRNADGIWEALRQRLLEGAGNGPSNTSGRLLALDALHPDRRRDLLLALLEQFAQLRSHLRGEETTLDPLLSRWQDGQAELRRQALSRMAGTYVQLPSEGGLRPVAETLLRTSELALEDPELPDPRPMLSTLLLARPLLVDGRLLPPDDPQAVLYLELLLANWLIRSAELISAEVLAACAEWPELRRYLLRPEFLPTRNLERLRNRLNAQQRWADWFERPIHLYESRRSLYQLSAGSIRCVDLTEPRDGELRRLGWPQQLVTLALEARDALAPQLQNLMRGLGDLVVVLLTRVVGRAIGLVGRGIAQGMGRSLGQG